MYKADDEARTRYLNLGKVALYLMSYIRVITDSSCTIAHPWAFVNPFAGKISGGAAFLRR